MATSYERETKDFMDNYVYPQQKEVKNVQYDIALMGWWPNTNYGSVITYYGLRQTLIEMGYSVLMVDVLTKNQVCDETLLGKEFAEKMGYYISKPYDENNLILLNNHCNTFMVGSDQMWGLWARNIMGLKYYLDFAYDNKRKIAVGVSLGDEKYVEKNYFSKNKCFVQRFDAISVREKFATEMMKYYYDVEAKYILDPLFLCDRRAYYYLAENSGVKPQDKYVLCYILDPSENNNKRIKLISSELGLPVKVIIGKREASYKENRQIMDEFDIIDANEEEWLGYILNSSFVITDSFHGTCMSIVFKKDFVSLVNFKRGADRFYSLLNEFKLNDRVSLNEEDITVNIKPIDYERVYEKLEILKEDGKIWLQNSLNIPKESEITEMDELKRMNYRLYKKIVNIEDIIKSRPN